MKEKFRMFHITTYLMSRSEGIRSKRTGSMPDLCTRANVWLEETWMDEFG